MQRQYIVKMTGNASLWKWLSYAETIYSKNDWECQFMEVAVLCRDNIIVKMTGNVSDWLSYAGGALIKVADSAGSTVQ